ncbi:MAG: hypothetical protein MRZ82_03950 [Firmicutes bacterium]|nr:hypothetical protein [Bacillota bacterium]
MNVGTSGQWNQMKMVFLMVMVAHRVRSVALGEVSHQVTMGISNVIFVEMNSVGMAMVDFI